MQEAEIYLFLGPEAGEKNEAIENMRKNAEKKNGQVDFYKYFVADIRVQDVVAQLQNESLFASALFIVLRNAELIKSKTDIEALSIWAKGASSSANTLVLVSDENSIEKKLESLVPSGHKKVFWEMFDNRKEQWLRDYFRKNGFGIQQEAIEQILDMVENNTESLKNECSKFFYCFPHNYTVTLKDVDKILSHNREENAFTLFEAMADKSQSQTERFETCLEILQKIRLSKDSSGVMLIAGLTYCFRQLREWHALHSKSPSPTDLQLKQAGFSGKMNQARYKNAASVWGAGVTSSIIALLSATDIAIREGGQQLEDTRLIMMLYSIIIKKGLFCASYEK